MAETPVINSELASLTCYIILKNPQNTFPFRHDRFKLKDSNLTYANEVKFLGVILEHLNCHAHINFFSKSTSFNYWSFI